MLLSQASPQGAGAGLPRMFALIFDARSRKASIAPRGGQRLRLRSLSGPTMYLSFLRLLRLRLTRSRRRRRGRPRMFALIFDARSRKASITTRGGQRLRLRSLSGPTMYLSFLKLLRLRLTRSRRRRRGRPRMFALIFDARSRKASIATRGGQRLRLRSLSGPTMYLSFLRLLRLRVKRGQTRQ
ncbi:hypothetical protein UC8_31590 [Roseimaritima ulvae]|uniref:Uncharacterized protein n=1 Tax=Roseimaritima ulvae TaxID=980254 RepID=A0A5B9QTR1_9BACT|nr:hypothetical protein UC8_31590 [Roseimaritima ulvae]